MPYVFSLNEWMDDYHLREDERFRPASRFGRALLHMAESVGRRLGEWRRPALPRTASA